MAMTGMLRIIPTIPAYSFVLGPSSQRSGAFAWPDAEQGSEYTLLCADGRF
jgi:hypothetical protein